MRNPNLSTTFVLELMQSDTDTLNLSEAEYAGLLAAAVINPELIKQSRRTGRGIWFSSVDGNSPNLEYGKMWELAAGKLLNVNPVPYRIFKYVQTTSEIKEAVYRQLSGKDHENLRAAILAGCEPSRDSGILSLGCEEADWRCRGIAAERCGSHLEAIREKGPRSTSR